MTAEAPRPVATVVRDSLAVGVSVGISGLAFGVAGASAGLDTWQTAATSLLVFTGASQFALVGALAAGAAPGAAVAGAIFLGVRNVFYGLQLSERMQLPGRLRPLAAHLTIDETTAVALAQPDRRSARVGFTVTGLTLFLLWNATTVIGALGAGAVGDPAAWGFDAAAPAVFLALLGPRLASGVDRAVAAIGAALAIAGALLLPPGVPVLLSLAAIPLVLGARLAKARS